MDSWIRMIKTVMIMALEHHLSGAHVNLVTQLYPEYLKSTFFKAALKKNLYTCIKLRSGALRSECFCFGLKAKQESTIHLKWKRF